MRIKRIRIKNFRSVFNDGDNEEMELDLSPSNYIVGPNNVGKSNIFRALRLALRPDTEEYDPDLDQPKQMHYSYPTITLDFQMERERSRYKTLLDYIEEYERSIIGDKETFAENGRIRFYVKYGVEKGSRTALFQAKGKGTIKGDEELLNKALDKFYDTIRLVDIESGEDLDSLLQRGFNELFARVLSERFRNEINNAKDKRTDYLNYLSDDILGEVDNYVTEELSRHISGIENVDFGANIQSVEDTLANISIEMDDSVSTPLSEKGTGVRSVFIQMIMAFIADASRRAVVFAVEEPEAFLHPERHAELGKNLESFTSQSDISLLVTTHSPFILTNNTDASVFTATKNSNGRTLIQTERVRQLSINNAKKLLTGSSTTPDTTDIIESVPESADAILVVEGWTDKSFIETAAELSGIDNPLQGIHIIDSEGANDAMKNSVVMRSIYGDSKSVITILDDDEHGRGAYSTLTGKLGFQGNNEVFKYSNWRPKHGQDVEAEDMFSDDLINEFIDEHGDSSINGWMERSDGTKHIDISTSSKSNFAEWVDEEAEKEDCEKFIDCLEEILENIN